MRERQDVAEARVTAMANEVSQAGQRLGLHAGAIRTLTEAMRGHVKRREELNEALEKLMEIAAVPVTLDPLPEEL